MEFSDAAGGYQCYGIFDGHWGTKAAKFASRTLHAHVQSLWLDDLKDETLAEAVREVSEWFALPEIEGQECGGVC